MTLRDGPSMPCRDAEPRLRLANIRVVVDADIVGGEGEGTKFTQSFRFDEISTKQTRAVTDLPDGRCAYGDTVVELRGVVRAEATFVSRIQGRAVRLEHETLDGLKALVLEKSEAVVGLQLLGPLCLVGEGPYEVWVLPPEVTTAR